jgi:hypothetical protein
MDFFRPTRTTTATYNSRLLKTPLLGRKTGVGRKIFGTFFCVFSIFGHLSLFKSLHFNDKRKAGPSRKNHTKKPTVGFSPFRRCGKICAMIECEIVNRVGLGRTDRPPVFIREIRGFFPCRTTDFTDFTDFRRHNPVARSRTQSHQSNLHGAAEADQESEVKFPWLNSEAGQSSLRYLRDFLLKSLHASYEMRGYHAISPEPVPFNHASRTQSHPVKPAWSKKLNPILKPGQDRKSDKRTLNPLYPCSC